MSVDSDAIDVRNNAEANRFEVVLDGKLAMIEYMITGKNITFTHTETPTELEGRGIASAMARVALEYARDQQLKVIPLCPFVAGYIRNHPEYQPLVFQR
jgi:hypothetical protein